VKVCASTPLGQLEDGRWELDSASAQREADSSRAKNLLPQVIERSRDADGFHLFRTILQAIPKHRNSSSGHRFRERAARSGLVPCQTPAHSALAADSYSFNKSHPLLIKLYQRAKQKNYICSLIVRLIVNSRSEKNIPEYSIFTFGFYGFGA
jgi:hypothetical protein